MREFYSANAELSVSAGRIYGSAASIPLEPFANIKQYAAATLKKGRQADDRLLTGIPTASSCISFQQKADQLAIESTRDRIPQCSRREDLFVIWDFMHSVDICSTIQQNLGYLYRAFCWLTGLERSASADMQRVRTRGSRARARSARAAIASATDFTSHDLQARNSAVLLSCIPVIRREANFVTLEV